ncbi:hypothetical protein DTO96_102432 [Ephemeroptericola cinctiostellae]|uniref:Phage protein Gp37/Gp68 n=1 Tax=Ephemeroptericola cinctiostellae TaxID=2268024 RepID=A0A345DE89_9BURK|nr:phage Gp37/Gp68 family protein [Ephemeroptericola cinctiostellae]AXF86677.1 hypothetical protein DTO96_102432 [Ephemeroptericola cinctiostellae]
MAENSNIEWCDHTFNPWIGCTKVSPACDNCYAASFGNRFGIEWGSGKPRKRTSESNWNQPLRWNRQAELKQNAWEKFKGRHPGLTDEQLIERGFIKPVRPRMFCASLADVFDNEVPSDWRADLFDLIGSTPHLDWLLLTKRIGNAQKMLNEYFPSGWGNWVDRYPNIWLGATICNQEEADRDIPKLLKTPAAVRFLSIEPLLGQIDLNMSLGGTRWIGGQRGCNGKTNGEHHHDERCGRGIDWVIVGGESGKDARPMHSEWVRSLRDQCAEAGVPFFFKQWGEWIQRHDLQASNSECVGKLWHTFDPDSSVCRIGKKTAGRFLDGVEYSEYPMSES